MKHKIEQEKEICLKMQDYSRNIDKVFQLHLFKHHSDAGYTVLSKYGRRYGNLTTHVKNENPIHYSVANALFTRILEEKMRKGYIHE